jgi:hypothetical protein
MDSIFNQPKPTVTVSDEIKSAVVENAAPFPLPSGRKFQYGTAGVSGSVTECMILVVDIFSYSFV